MPPIILIAAAIALTGLLWPSGNSDKKTTPADGAPSPPKRKRWVSTGVKRKKAKEAKPDESNPD